MVKIIKGFPAPDAGLLTLLRAHSTAPAPSSRCSRAPRSLPPTSETSFSASAVPLPLSLSRLFRHFRRVDLTLQRFVFVRRVVHLAKFFLNRFHLLVQIVLALGFLHLLFTRLRMRFSTCSRSISDSSSPSDIRAFVNVRTSPVPDCLSASFSGICAACGGAARRAGSCTDSDVSAGGIFCSA